MNDYNNYFEDYMKIINITTNTTITAEICGQVTKIEFYEKIGAAELILKNSEGIDEHWNIYEAADDMLFAVILGVGNDKNDDKTWSTYSKTAGWWRCAYSLKNVRNSDMSVIIEIVDAIEDAIQVGRKMYEIQKIIDIANS